jgi:hypothetical protein
MKLKINKTYTKKLRTKIKNYKLKIKKIITEVEILTISKAVNI